jgi:hypothetical protein
MFPAGDQFAVPFTEPNLGLPADVLERFRLFFQSELEMPAHFRWVPIRPGAFDQSTTGMRIPRFGNGPLSASLARGVYRGHEAQKFHECSGGIEARQVAELGHGGDSHGAWHPTQGLKGLDHRVQTPGFDLLVECLFETLEAFGVVGHGADIFLQDGVLPAALREI